MDEAKQLNERALTILFDGKTDEAMPLVRRALDLDPTLREALDNLASAASMYPDKYRDELFSRLERAHTQAHDGASRLELAWLELRYVTFFNQIDAAKRLVASPAPLIGNDPARRAEIAALVVELGDAATGELMLRADQSPLAIYHLARLSADHGASAAAAELIEKLSHGDEARLLHELARASLALSAGNLVEASTLLLQKIHAISQREQPYALSEWLFLRMRLAHARQQTKETEDLAKELSLVPQRVSPSVMLRAAALVGPLYKLGQVR
jgi:hypothetical protein